MTRTNRVVISYGMKINTKTTKAMQVSKVRGQVDISLEGRQFEKVASLKYVGSTVTQNGQAAM